ncbi:hypothetical protein N7449_000129 [Penicillium cf. viridicatum]|uniref:Uncharacterized protein n=1 Tax=Penicillium cf. viridicatum TaxID=2972119 RepID=A0A9W9T910_9EURO|nr:hypothetical protein N7449_000129 [Penicillium cf. viridicatum]
MSSPGPPLPPDILVDEEISAVYDSKYFYPVKPGEVRTDRYQTLVKVGWGILFFNQGKQAPDRLISARVY